MILRDGLEDSSAGERDPYRYEWGTSPRHAPTDEAKLVPRPGFTGDGKLGQFGSNACVFGPAGTAPAGGFTRKVRLAWREAGATS